MYNILNFPIFLESILRVYVRTFMCVCARLGLETSHELNNSIHILNAQNNLPTPYIRHSVVSMYSMKREQINFVHFDD